MNSKPQDTIFRQESLERLSSPEQLDQLMQVVNSKSWLSLATLGSLVFLALLWSVLGRIPISAIGKGVLVHPNRSSTGLVALTYFDRNMGERITPGMQVTIVPDSSSDRSGGIVGQVESVSNSITTLDAARQVGSTGLEQGSIEVLIALDPDSSNRSGYRWSTSVDNPPSIAPGTTATARIVLERKAPIAFALPFWGGS